MFTTNTSVISAEPAVDALVSSRPSWLKRHPIAGYFILAYALAWLAWLPLELARNGFRLLPVTLPFFPFAVLATFGGPTVAAFIMTRITEGPVGVRALRRRYLQWRFGAGWYALILLGMPLTFLLASSVALGAAPWQTLALKAPMFLSSYPPLLVVSLFTGPLGEEPGWRGFALPRMQARLGAVRGAWLLGILWAAWHIPLFFLQEWRGATPIPVFASAFFSWVVPFAIVMAWVSNRTRGNLVAMILMHDALNAIVGLVALHILLVPHDLYLQAKIWWPLALLLIVVTRGRLGMRPAMEEPKLADAVEARQEQLAHG